MLSEKKSWMLFGGNKTITIIKDGLILEKVWFGKQALYAIHVFIKHLYIMIIINKYRWKDELIRIRVYKFYKAKS